MPELLMIAIYIIGGLILLYFGANWLVQGAITLALHLGLSPLIVGLTVVALGTSVPEALVTVRAAIGHQGGITGRVLSKCSRNSSSSTRGLLSSRGAATAAVSQLMVQPGNFCFRPGRMQVVRKTSPSAPILMMRILCIFLPVGPKPLRTASRLLADIYR